MKKEIKNKKFLSPSKQRPFKIIKRKNNNEIFFQKK